MEYPIYVAGQFIKTKETFEVKNPYDDSLIATTYRAGKEELEKAIKAAEKVRQEMADLPIYKRYKILMHVAERLKEKREELGMILAKECGKPLSYSIAEIDRAVQTFITSAEESKRIPAEIMTLDWEDFNHGRKAYIERFPVGIVAGIAPFNFPCNLVAHKIGPAIAAGCPIILKPATATPLSALELAKILDETDLPKGALSIMPMDRDSGNQLVTDDRFALLSFTGSPHVGWKMKAECGKKKVVLELGGNAGAIITEHSDLDHAVARCTIGGFGNNGQSCIHTQRILVHKSLLNKFFTQYKKAVESLRVGDPTDPKTQMAGMIDEKNAIRIEEWIEEATKAGAQIITGGKRKGPVVEPTVLTKTDKSMKVVCEEVFGPVVVVEPYTDFEEAIDHLNNSDFGLQAGVFTDNWNQMQYAFKNLHVGGVVINDVPTFRADQQPYGGVKDSGIGREGPRYAILDMLEERVMITS